jgi:hypothetical protein
MSSEIIAYYTGLGFEETEIEDGLTALAYEIPTDESYVLLTDEDGKMPVALKQPVLLAYYTPEGAFQWSIGFKNSPMFKDIWSVSDNPARKLEALLEYRATKEQL